MKKFMKVIFTNGETWKIPTIDIAMNRAENFADEFGGDVQKSLTEDTIPLFESCEYEIEDWAKNNMNWDNFKNKELVEQHFSYQDNFGDADIEIE